MAGIEVKRASWMFWCGLVLSLHGLMAICEPLPEVTVSGKRLDDHTLNHVVMQFVQSHAQPSSLIGQIGRWRADVCPTVSGLRPQYNDFVVRRIIDVAHSVGAPTRSSGRKCAINVEVYFTGEPQPLLDHIASKYHPLLGFYRASETRQMTTISHPIQAWYVTGSRSLDYQPPITGLDAAPSGDMAIDASAISPIITGLVVDSDSNLGASGRVDGHLSHGLRSEFIHVMIIVDSTAVSKYPLQPVSDYIALLALTRLSSLDACSDLPSIVNLFASGCGTAPAGLTSADTAYLKALYAADLEQNLNLEQGDLRDRMLQVIRH